MDINRMDLEKLRDKIYARAKEIFFPLPARWFVSCPIGTLADKIRWKLGENAGFAIHSWLYNLMHSEMYSEKEAAYLLKIANEYLEKTEKKED